MVVNHEVIGLILVDENESPDKLYVIMIGSPLLEVEEEYKTRDN